jgi:acyl-CoA thioesterase
VAPGRVSHSPHGYFLRRGDAARPTIFRVDRDRDGRSFSARRVVAVHVELHPMFSVVTRALGPSLDHAV